MVKLLHTADLHLDSPLRTLALRDLGLRDAVENATRAALSRIVDVAIAEEVAAVLIAGDLYDGNQTSMKTAAFLIGELQRLDDADISVFLIRGNHDAESRIPAKIAWPANVHVFSANAKPVALGDTGITIHGISFSESRAPKSLVPRYRPVAGQVNIALLHTSLGGAAGHDPYAPCSISDLVETGFDYWALGHIHKRSVHHENPFVVMPGMPQGRDIGEDGEKSATLICIEDGQIRLEERATSALVFRRAECDLSEAETIADVLTKIRQSIRNQVGETPTVLRLTLTGQTPAAWQVRRDADLINESAQDAAPVGRVWIDKVVLQLSTTGADEPAAGAADEIASLIHEVAGETGFQDIALDVIEDLVAGLPGELRDLFGTDPDRRYEHSKRLTTLAIEHAVARMSGASEDVE